MKNLLRKPRLPVVLLAAGLLALSCEFANDAYDDGTSIEERVVSGDITLAVTPFKPVDAYVCCFSRQAAWGNITDGEGNNVDQGVFNSWGDYRHPGYAYDGNPDTWWQSNYMEEHFHRQSKTWDGRHWILIDLGESRKINVLKIASHKANTTFYQVYASANREDLMAEHDNEWYFAAKMGKADRPGDRGGSDRPFSDCLVGTGMLDGLDGEKTITLDGDITARYVMLRTQKSTIGADRTIDEIWAEYRDLQGFAGFDNTAMIAAYNRALALLQILPRDTADYIVLRAKLFDTMNANDPLAASFRSVVQRYIGEEAEIVKLIPLMQYEKQKEADALTKIMTDLLDRLDPPREPPEVL
jgi:hypothetical protein